MSIQLSGSQRRYLRAEAHQLKAVVQVGKQGVSSQVVAQIASAFDAHELIKVQYPAEREEKEGLVDLLQDRLGAVCAGIVGHVLILYRRHPDPDQRRYSLPS